MARTLTPFLMFEGAAEEALRLYLSLFPGSTVNSLIRYAAGERGAEGSVKRAEITVAGQSLICIDSPVKHGFSFTPALSLFVECDSEPELNAAFDQLSAGGSVLMPPNHYGFSTRFCWVNDPFGVSWQLNVR